MKKFLCVVILMCDFLLGVSQAPFWNESFGVGCNQGQLANGFNPSGNGMWTATTLSATSMLGPNNDWFISATESGMGIGSCGDGCLASGGTNRTLHVGVNAPTFSNVDQAAVYISGINTLNKRIESPIINCSGHTNIVLSFKYIMVGNMNFDYSDVVFSDDGGISWNSLLVPPQTNTCSTNKSVWATYSIALPSTVYNNPNVKLGFRWQNISSTSNAVSFAVDDIALASSTLNLFVPSFTLGNSICLNGSVSVTAITGTNSVSGYTWNVSPNGSMISSPNSSNTSISFTTTGLYTVSLTASSGTQTATYSQNITVNSLPAIAISANPPIYQVCPGKSATLTAYGGATTYTWFPITSTINPAVVSPTVLTNYTVVGTSSVGCTSSNTVNIYVATNPTLVVSGPLSACSGSSICLSASAGSGPLAYSWSGPCGFSSNLANPCFPIFSGCGCTYVVSVQNPSTCTDTKTICININPSPTLNISSSNTLLCTNFGQSSTLSLSGTVSSYTWSTGLTNTSIVVTPTATTSYSVTGLSLNGCQSTSVYTQSATICGGIVENESGFMPDIYPNPAKNKLFLNLNNDDLSKISIEILDLQGRVLNKVIHKDLNNYSIDVEDLRNGFYYLRIRKDIYELKVVEFVKE